MGKVLDVLLDVPSCAQVIPHNKQDSDISLTVRFRRRVCTDLFLTAGNFVLPKSWIAAKQAPQRETKAAPSLVRGFCQSVIIHKVVGLVEVAPGTRNVSTDDLVEIHRYLPGSAAYPHQLDVGVPPFDPDRPRCVVEAIARHERSGAEKLVPVRYRSLQP